MTTVFIGLAVVIINHRQTRLRDIAEAHRAKKTTIYKEYIKTITSLILGENKETAAVILAVDNLYKAIRNDIGLSNSGLNNHELVKIFITDRAELDKLMKPKIILAK